MATTSNIHNLLYTFDLYRGMQENRLEYIYRGPFTDKIVELLMQLAEANLKEDTAALSTKKKLYFLMVESLQNITRHQQDPIEFEASDISGLFIIRKEHKRYFLTTGNCIRIEEIPHLKAHLDKVNSLSAPELKSHYRKVLDEGEISPKGGAGLGLIGMARKSGNKLEYSFKQVDETNWYFYLNMALDDILPDEEKDTEVDSSYFESISSMHDLLNKENILLNYCGSFKHDSYTNIEEIISTQVGDQRQSLRIQTVVKELVQNIAEHGSDIDSKPDRVSGILIFSTKEGHYRIATGNYIRNQKINYFKEQIRKSCIAYHQIKQQDNIDDAGNSQSFLKIQIASRNCLNWDVHPFNDEFSFLTIMAIIE